MTAFYFASIQISQITPHEVHPKKGGWGKSDFAVGVESQHLADFNKNTKDPTMQIFSQIHQKTSEL